MAKINLDGILSGFKSVAKIIANFTSIETALNDKVLYRDNPEGEPNQMANELDMNGQAINNLPQATNATQPATYGQLLATSVDSGTAVTTVRNTATGDGIQTVFSAPVNYVQGQVNLTVYVDGIFQSGGYTESSVSEITFTTAPADGAVVSMIVNERTVETPIPTTAGNVTATYEGSPSTSQAALNDLRTDLDTTEALAASNLSRISTAEGEIDVLQASSVKKIPVTEEGLPTFTAEVNTDYLIENKTTTVTLPSSATNGDRISLISNDATNKKLSIKPQAGFYIAERMDDNYFAEAGSGTGVLVSSLFNNDFENDARFKYNSAINVNNIKYVINLTTGSYGSISAIDTATQTATSTTAVFSTSDEFAFGYISSSLGLVFPEDSQWNTVDLVYREDTVSGAFTGSWFYDVKYNDTTLAPTFNRKTGINGGLNKNERLIDAFYALDDFLSVRLDSSNTTFNLFNSTLTNTAGSALDVDGVDMPTSIYWVGEGDFFVKPNETILNTDYLRPGITTGGREPTLLCNASAGDNIYVTLTGLSTTTGLTLINGTQNTVTGTGIAFVANNTITDTGSGLGVYAVGDKIKVSGSVANDGYYEVATVAAGTITTVETSILVGAAGPSVTLTTGAYRGSGDITVPPGTSATIRRLSDTEVMVYSQNSGVTK